LFKAQNVIKPNQRIKLFVVLMWSVSIFVILKEFAYLGFVTKTHFSMANQQQQDSTVQPNPK